MASPLSTTGRRSLLAGIGAAASLIAAVIAIALIGPGLVGFESDTVAPVESPATRALPFGESSPQPGTRAGAGSSDAPVAAGRGAARAPTTPAGTTSPGRRAERGSARSGGTAATTAPDPERGTPPRPASPPRGAGATEPVARGVQETGSSVGRASERLGSSAAAPLAQLNPFLGQTAERAGSATGRHARQAGDTVGSAIRDLVPPPQTLK